MRTTDVPPSRSAPLTFTVLVLFLSLLRLPALEAITDKIVVLTFDDSVKSHFTVVRPILKQHGFGATFFITEGFNFKECMTHLAENDFRVIALRDLEKFVDPAEIPSDPQAVIRERQAAVAANDLKPYFETLATEGRGPSGFASTEAAKRAALTLQLPVINPWIPVPDTVRVERNIEYGNADGESLLLDLYSPKDLDRPTPGLVFIHGGAWKGGNRRDYHYYGVQFAEKGYVVATISYRLLPEHPFPAAVHDAKCAVRWLRSHAGERRVLPDRIAAIGGSAGGHLAMMIAYSSDLEELEGNGGNAGAGSHVRAVVNLYGPVVLSTPYGRNSRLVHSFLGHRSFDEAPDIYRQASPLTHLDRKDPPTLIVHGTIDDTVPIAQADILARRLKELGIPFRYDRLEGWPHALDLSREVNARVVRLMHEFFQEHLSD